MLLQLNQVEVTKLNLQSGEVLVVTIKHDDVSSDNIKILKEMFNDVFPNNQTLILAVGKDDDIKLTSVKSIDTVRSSCETGNFCNDCNCGKKEDFLNSQNGEQNDI